jgi:N-methylhydantoinase B
VSTPADYAYRGEGVGAPSSFGAQGGKAGVGGEVMLTLADGNKRVDGWKYGVHRFGPATYRSLSPGGGGFGNPKTRAPERVLRDVRDGIVSVAAAERDYGVAITADGRRVDVERTARLRS